MSRTVVISFILMTVVLRLSSHPRHGRFTGVAAGLQAALSFLFRGTRLTVEQATHDEEMFI